VLFACSVCPDAAITAAFPVAATSSQTSHGTASNKLRDLRDETQVVCSAGVAAIVYDAGRRYSADQLAARPLSVRTASGGWRCPVCADLYFVDWTHDVR